MFELLQVLAGETIFFDALGILAPLCILGLGIVRVYRFETLKRYELDMSKEQTKLLNDGE